MMVYGKEDETVPPEDMLNFAETLERCGADVTLVSMDSGHRVTSLKDANNLRLLDATVDLKSLAQLKGEVSWWLDGNSVLEPCGEQDLMDIEKNIDRCSELLETKPCGFGIKGYREGDGTLIYISR